MIKFIKKNALLLIGGLILIFVFSKSFFQKEKQIHSVNTRVNSVIHVLDSAFNSLGTFDSHLEPIFKALSSLSSLELKLLHKDFGIRYYNSLYGYYIKMPILKGLGLSRPFDLNSLYNAEFDSNQLKRLKAVYMRKGVEFPFLG